MKGKIKKFTLIGKIRKIKLVTKINKITKIEIPFYIFYNLDLYWATLDW